MSAARDVGDRRITRREELLVRIERLTELPLLVLAFLMVPLLIGPWLWDLSPGASATFTALDAFIWAAFAVDFGVKVAIAPDRRAFLRHHWLDALIVAIPFIRPLRIIRLILYGSRAFRGVRRMAQLDFLLVWALGMVILGATAVLSFEQAHDSTIRTFPDALWWATVTVTTVGYGDFVPVTAVGRAVAMALMVGGIGIFGGLAANLAAFFIRVDTAAEEDRRTARLLREIRALSQQVAALSDRSAQQE